MNTTIVPGSQRSFRATSTRGFCPSVDHSKTGQVAVMIQQQVQLDGSFGTPELRPSHTGWRTDR